MINIMTTERKISINTLYLPKGYFLEVYLCFALALERKERIATAVMIDITAINPGTKPSPIAEVVA